MAIKEPKLNKNFTSGVQVVSKKDTPDQRKPEVNPFVDRRDSSLYVRRKRIYINQTWFGTQAATAANYKDIWIAPRKGTVLSAKLTYATSGGASSTLDVEKLTGTQASGAGSSVLASTFDLTATANTVQTRESTTTNSNRSFEVGDRLGAVHAGTIGSLNNVVLVIEVVYDYQDN